MSGCDVIIVLHGDPVIPSWLRASEGIRIHLIVNDPAPGRYRSLPDVTSVHRNTARAGFAENVNAAAGRLLAADPGLEDFVVANFDMDVPAGLRPVVAELRAGLAVGARVACAAPLLCSADGRPIFSAGRVPRPANEFLRAAGLRQGRALRWQRALLRQLPGWRRRNDSAGSARFLGAGEYLPWTCIAIRTAAWREVGPLDERFPLYAEDIDWGMRAAGAGWSARLVDAGRVIHHERATRSPMTDALYEASHLKLHTKAGHIDCLRWQRAGLAVRRAGGPLLPELDWEAFAAASSDSFRMSMLPG